MHGRAAMLNRLPMGDCWVFADNIAARGLPFSEAMLRELWAESVADYAALPLHCAGHSKELRRTSVPGILIGRFLPTLYSYTNNRAGQVPGTDTLRLQISRLFWRHLHGIGIATCYLACGTDFVLLSEEGIPPVEVIVKRALLGTPAHIYRGLFEHRDRFGQPFVKGEPHPPYVRFDYRNPLTSADGERLRDETMPLGLADRLIDTAAAGERALRITAAVDVLLNAVGLQVLDICLFFDDAGKVLCGEISPDNMRIKSLADGGDSTRTCGERTARLGRSSRNGPACWQSSKAPTGRPMPLEIVIDGTDAGGKTPCVEALCRSLAAGRTVRSCAPFRVQEVYDLWERDPGRAADIIRAIMDDFRRAHAAADVIVWDRGWPTVWVSTTDVQARETLLPFPDLTVLLLNTVETTRRKVEQNGLQAVWVNDPALLRRYHDAYHALPAQVTDGAIAAFLPDGEGRYDYVTIIAAILGRLKLDLERPT
jgi:phosphoribosylaminoimidazole-succinocarboxamide synthase